jgi:hypothetical protein
VLSRETLIEFSSFVFPRPPCRDEPTDVAANRERDGDFAIVDVAEDLVPDLAMTI